MITERDKTYLQCTCSGWSLFIDQISFYLSEIMLGPLLYEWRLLPHHQTHTQVVLELPFPRRPTPTTPAAAAPHTNSIVIGEHGRDLWRFDAASGGNAVVVWVAWCRGGLLRLDCCAAANVAAGCCFSENCKPRNASNSNSSWRSLTLSNQPDQEHTEPTHHASVVDSSKHSNA